MYVLSNDNTDVFVCRQNDKRYSIYDLEFITPINWENRRYELAKAAMGGFVGNSDTDMLSMTIEQIVRISIRCADEMIKQLKEIKKIK